MILRANKLEANQPISTFPVQSLLGHPVHSAGTHLMVGAPLNDSVRLLLMGDLVTLTILFSCRDTFRYHDCGGGQTGFRLLYQSPNHSGSQMFCPQLFTAKSDFTIRRMTMTIYIYFC